LLTKENKEIQQGKETRQHLFMKSCDTGANHEKQNGSSIEIFSGNFICQRKFRVLREFRCNHEFVSIENCHENWNVERYSL